MRLDRLDQRLARIDIDARILVTEAGNGFLLWRNMLGSKLTHFMAFAGAIFLPD